MDPVTPLARARAAAALAAAATTGPTLALTRALTGCTFTNPQTTQKPYIPGDGQDVSLGVGVRIGSLMVVTADEGEPGRLVAREDLEDALARAADPAERRAAVPRELLGALAGPGGGGGDHRGLERVEAREEERRTPAPELGADTAANTQLLLSAWWVPVVPGVAVLVLSLVSNLAGDGIRTLVTRR